MMKARPDSSEPADEPTRRPGLEIDVSSPISKSPLLLPQGMATVSQTRCNVSAV